MCALAVGAFTLSCTGSGPTVTVLGYAVVIKTAPPGSAQVGAAVPIALTVTALSSDGSTSPAAGKPVSVAVTAGGGTIAGSVTATLVTGSDGSLATTWTLGPLVGTQTIRGSVSASEFLDINIQATAAPATALAISTQPSSAVIAGAVLAAQPVVQLRTAAATNAVQAGVVVSAAIASGGGTLAGATSATTDANGTATFSGLSISGATGNITLRFTANLSGVPVSVTSAPIAVAPPTWTQLAIATQPASSANSGVMLTRQPAIQLKDATGASVAVADVPITASLASGTGVVGGNLIAITDASGLATFTDLAITGTTNTVALRFSASAGAGPMTITSSTIALTAPNQLSIAVAPASNAGNGVALFAQPKLQLLDGSGNALRQAGIPVTVSVASGIATVSAAAGGAGSLTVNTDANGVAAFHDLILTGVGTNTLGFAAPAFAPAVSPPVLVTVVPTAISLANSVPAGPFIANSGDLSYYAFTVPQNAITLDFATYGGLGNIELYVRRGLNPTATDFDCHASVAGPAQICTFSTNTSGQYFMLIKAASNYSGTMVRANAYSAGCLPKANLTLGMAVTGTLSLATGCLVEQQQTLHDRYSIVIPTTRAVTITSSSSSSSNTNFIAWRLPDAQVNYYGQAIGVAPVTTFPILWGPGTYTVMVGDASGTNIPRDYTLQVDATPAQPSGCGTILAYGPVNTSLTLTNADCPGTVASTYSHRIALLLSTGQTVTVTMSSTSFDPLVRLLAGLSLGAGTVVAQDDNSGGGTSARMSFTNTDPASDAQFTLEFTSALPSATGAYTFTITTTPAVYNLRRPGSAAIPSPASAPILRAGPPGPRRP